MSKFFDRSISVCANNKLKIFFHLFFRVQETDGSYFESFTALSWKRDNRRFSAIRVSETRAETLPENEREQKPEDDIERPEQLEQLYVDVLYTVANTVGAPAPGGQVIKTPYIHYTFKTFPNRDTNYLSIVNLYLSQIKILNIFNSLPITKRKCFCKLSVRLAYRQTITTVCCIRPLKKSRKLLYSPYLFRTPKDSRQKMQTVRVISIYKTFIAFIKENPFKRESIYCHFYAPLTQTQWKHMNLYRYSIPGGGWWTAAMLVIRFYFEIIFYVLKKRMREFQQNDLFIHIGYDT